MIAFDMLNVPTSSPPGSPMNVRRLRMESGPQYPAPQSYLAHFFRGADFRWADG